MAASPLMRVPAPMQPVVRKLIRIYMNEQRKAHQGVDKNIIEAFLKKLEDTNSG